MLLDVSGTPTDQAHSAPSVEDTLKDFWATRPKRPRRGRKIAGVAAAVGDRYGMDPVIVRVAFVVATFYGGAGILLYLLGWLFFAEEGDEVSPVEALGGKGRSSASSPFTVALLIALIPVFGLFFDNDFAGWLGMAAILGVLFLLHRGRGHLARPPAAPDAPVTAAMGPIAAPGSAAGAAPGAGPGPVDQYGYPTTPPAWDPLGAAPFAWDLPEPGGAPPEPEPPAPRHRSKAGPITLAAVFLTIGAAVLAEPVLGDWVTARHVIGVVLAVLGLGMVAGSFVRGGRGLIGLAVPLAAAGVAMTVLWPNGFSAEGVGDLQAKPTTLEQVQSDYRRNIGSVAVDLTGLPATGSVRTSAGVDVGEVTVTVPATADVTLRCSVGVGEVDCLGEQQGGPGAELSRTDLGPDGAGGLKIEIDAEVSGPGTVQVRRG